jgi:hypothetical protein
MDMLVSKPQSLEASFKSTSFFLVPNAGVDSSNLNHLNMPQQIVDGPKNNRAKDI